MLEKINFKIYFAFSTFLLAVAFWLLPSTHDFIYLFYVFLATMLNHFILVFLVLELTAPKGKNTFKIIGLFIAKTLLLCACFGLLVYYARQLTFQGIFLYIFQLINLFLSIKK